MALAIGLIGAGIHGRRYVDHIQNDLPALELRALSRRDSDAGRSFCSERGVSFFEDYAALIESPEVQAVVVVSPPGLHLDACLRALKAGKPVLVEKPMVRNLHEARVLAEAVEKRSGFLMVAQTLRYNRTLNEVKARLREISPLKLIRMSLRLPPRDVAWEHNPDLAGGGSVLLTGVHLFDAARWVFEEEISTAWCRIEKVFNPTLEDFFVAVLRLSRSGALFIAEVSKCTRSRAALLDVTGQAGQIWADYRNDEAYLIRGEDWKEINMEEKLVPTVRETLADFARCVNGKLPAPISVEDGLKTIEIAHACYESVATGSEVGLAETLRRAH